MTDYIGLDLYKSRYGITVFDKDARLAEHITAASRKVDAYCRRSFGPHVGVATTRTFHAFNCHTVYIDDAYDITAVDADDDDDGTYATSWPSTDYDTDPPNGVGPDGLTGWPITALRAIGDDVDFPTCTRRRPVRVTAKWGWPAIPDDVIEATYLYTARLAYEIAVPSGITPPNVDFGMPGIPLQRPYTAEQLLWPYRKVGRMLA